MARTNDVIQLKIVLLGHIYNIPWIKAENSSVQLGDNRLALTSCPLPHSLTEGHEADEVQQVFSYFRDSPHPELLYVLDKSSHSVAGLISSLMGGGAIMAEEAVKLERINQTFHSENQPCDVVSPGHFFTFGLGYFKNGRIFRIWEPENKYLHMRTFVLYQHLGDRGNSLPVQIYQKDDKVVQQGDFHENYIHLSTQPMTSTAAQSSANSLSESLYVKLEKGTRLSSDAWINTREKIHIRYENTRFSGCGMLTEESINRLRQKLKSDLED